jgi:prefoldin subunit 4
MIISKCFQRTLEGIDDASTELMMGNGEMVMVLFGGETFFEASEEAATEYCEKQVEKYQTELDKLSQEESSILEEQTNLKKILYGRFGKAIQLEEK